VPSSAPPCHSGFHLGVSFIAVCADPAVHQLDVRQSPGTAAQPRNSQLLQLARNGVKLEINSISAPTWVTATAPQRIRRLCAISLFSRCPGPCDRLQPGGRVDCLQLLPPSTMYQATFSASLSQQQRKHSDQSDIFSAQRCVCLPAGSLTIVHEGIISGTLHWWASQPCTSVIA
jgi:hypothetical protein